MPNDPLNSDAQKLVMEVTKQLVTLSVAAIGVITTMMFTTFKGTRFVVSAEVSLFSFLLSAASSVLAQLAVVAESVQDRTWFSINYPLALLTVAWILFVVALAAFVVFTWANINL